MASVAMASRISSARRRRGLPEVVAGREGVRFDSSVPDQRLAGWLVLLDDRYWVMELLGPQAGFDEVLSVVRPVLASMSFG